MAKEQLFAAPVEFDSSAAKRFLKKVLAETEDVEAAARVVLDLSGVQYISSAGIGAVLRIYRECRRAGSEVVLLVPRAEIRAILEVAGVDRLMKMLSEPPGESGQ